MQDRAILTNRPEGVLNQVVNTWMADPSTRPLVIEKVGAGQVAVSVGMPSGDFTITGAADALGMSYRTFRKRYLDAARVKLNTRGRVPGAWVRAEKARIEGV